MSQPVNTELAALRDRTSREMGLDCNDLVSDMNAAGYFLPEGDE